LIGLSLAYEFFFKPKPGLWPFIGLFFWPGLAYLKAWLGLQAYLQAYFIVRPAYCYKALKTYFNTGFKAYLKSLLFEFFS